MSALTPQEISLRLKALPHWSKRGKTILRTFQFKGFPESIDFVQRIAKKAQKADHHPDIDIRFDHVKLQLTTHDEGGLTGMDFSLAGQCNEVFALVSRA